MVASPASKVISLLARACLLGADRVLEAGDAGFVAVAVPAEVAVLPAPEPLPAGLHDLALGVHASAVN